MLCFTFDEQKFIFLLHGIFIGLKPLGGILLLILLIFPFVATFTWMEGRLASTRHAASLKIKKAIPVEEQLPWTFSRKEAEVLLDWKHSREFEYKGEMYDIIRTEVHGDSVTYWCYWDRKETKLRKQRNLIVFNLLGPSPLERNQQNTITVFFRSLCFSTLPLAPVNFAIIDVRRCITPYHPFHSEYHSDPHCPPPRLV